MGGKFFPVVRENYFETSFQLLDAKAGPATSPETKRELIPNALRRLLLKLVVNHNKLPSSFYLKDVIHDGSESTGAGAFADIFFGKWKGKPVALKRLRVEAKSPGPDQAQQKVRCTLSRCDGESLMA